MKSKKSRRMFCRACLGLGLSALAVSSVFSRHEYGKQVAENKKEEIEKTDEMIANCGLVCTGCPAYIAARTNDDSLRKKTAENWSKLFNADIRPAAINCDGCLSESKRLFAHCFECEIRKCCREKKVLNCALCPDFPCRKISDFMALVPEAESKLKEIRKKSGLSS